MRFTTNLALVTVSGATLALLSVGCGGGSSDLDAGGLDAAADSGTAMDAGHDAGRDAGTRDLGPGPIDAGTDPASVTTAGTAATTANCTCDYMGDYASVSDCVAVVGGSDVYDACLAMAFPTPDATDMSYLGCQASVSATYAACVTAASCADTPRMACDSARNTAQMACPAIPMAAGTALQTCVDTMLTGTGADSCSDTGTASSALGADVFTGTTIMMGDHRTGSCPMGGGGAPDVALRWTAPATGDYTIDTDNTLFDTVLYVLDGCGPTAAELACDDDADGLGYRSSLDVHLMAGQTVQIVVDGYGVLSAGSYHVNIAGPPGSDGGVVDGGVVDVDAGDVDAGDDAGTAPDAGDVDLGP